MITSKIQLSAPGLSWARVNSSYLFMFINQYLSYGDILAGRPGAWLVKKTKLYACNKKS